MWVDGGLGVSGGPAAIPSPLPEQDRFSGIYSLGTTRSLNLAVIFSLLPF